MDATARKSDELKALGEGLRQQLQSGLEEIAGSRRDALKASDEVQRSVAAIEAAVTGARQALGQAQGLAQHAEESAAAVTSGAQQLAEELRRAAVASEQIGPMSERLDSIERNLDQANAENRRLAAQVEGLARQFSGSSNGVTVGPAAIKEAPLERTLPPQHISREVAHPEGAGKAPAGLVQERQPQRVAEASPPPQKPAAGQMLTAHSEVSVPASSVSGPIQVTMSPVRGFEQVVRMDTALAGLPCVGDVALERYAQEEVTFLVDLIADLTIADFARLIGEAAGFSARILAGADGFVTLQVA